VQAVDNVNSIIAPALIGKVGSVYFTIYCNVVAKETFA